MKGKESVLCGGTLLRLIDTAGIRDTDDIVEQMGVERSRAAMESADLVLAVMDSSVTPTQEDAAVLELAATHPNWILVSSKNDLPSAPVPFLQFGENEAHHLQYSKIPSTQVYEKQVNRQVLAI